MIDLWYKNAVAYCLDVETFMDGNGDGIGDFGGLVRRLDYLEALGVNVIWLNPFYPTPNRDNGYDISDFYGVDPRHGHLGDFVDFMRGARDRGMRVLVDLVVNHVSIDHPWFQAARSSEQSPYRDWFVWSKKKPDDISNGIIFPGVQEAVWTYDRNAQSWYMHRFYEHQADLNIGNPQVRSEILKVMGFWLELGVSGFRIDAVPFLIEYKGLKEEPERDPLLLLSEMHDYLAWHSTSSIMLAEANVERDKTPDYFGGREFGTDERMHMLFDFPLNQYLWLGFVRKDAGPVAEALRSRPDSMPFQAQWAIFLRNHDELSLDKLTEDEREEAFSVLGPEPTMRLYDRGVRRRLAPMLGGDQRRLELAHALLYGLPGTPVMWYGDEIGMGEDLALDERWAVRTPMQWSAGRNAGFSARDGDTVVPVVSDGPFAAATVNVEASERESGSLLKKVQEMIRTRRSCPEVGCGEWRLIEDLPPSVLGLCYSWRGRSLVVLANFADHVVDLPAAALSVRHAKTELTSDGAHVASVDCTKLTLQPYGYLWLRPQPKTSEEERAKREGSR
jgi:maltose alpha-D-glucosyltransferase / alpha-amylase